MKLGRGKSDGDGGEIDPEHGALASENARSITASQLSNRHISLAQLAYR